MRLLLILVVFADCNDCRREPTNSHERRAQDAGSRGGHQEPVRSSVGDRPLPVSKKNIRRKKKKTSGTVIRSIPDAGVGCCACTLASIVDGMTTHAPTLVWFLLVFVCFQVFVFYFSFEFCFFCVFTFGNPQMIFIG